ncbi:uncharacterized protein LAESUDRAFT_738717 [Laetiporus sulphureus 93-53]|uniref:F-box domain-containing protein n=1 Tax=Laetiporus sulphureus 93-53 TaxID=1314785 RepID=A0A165C997_9APHY|nr:uncharacterized protein LAESUDRAFT_738717 [Laetiporus sulphureus 93-53]KZT02421.1 hypothetical protein LAESUDRAFT_738717 [Laetiporus sulphureus 93-53]
MYSPVPTAIILEPNEYTLYDSRAAIYERQGKTKDALRDSKKVIDLAPQRWQITKYDHALQMANLALERVAPDDSKRKSELDALREQITQSIDQLRKHASSMFCHFGKLPAEIAMAIFALALSDDHARVVVLAQVCKSWRATILAAPALWNTLVLLNKNPVKKAKVWKTRSKGRLVELHLKASLAQTPWALDLLQDMPLVSLRRFRVVSFPLSEVRARLPLLTEDVLRRLEVMEIEKCTEARPAAWLWSEPEMQVRTLSVHSTVFQWATVARHFKRLKDFTFRGPLVDTPISDVLTLLRENSNLQRLSLSMMDFPFQRPSEEDDEPVDLPRLTQLDIEYHDFAMSHIIPILSFPALRSFRVLRGTCSLDRTMCHLFTCGAAASLTELRIQQCVLNAHTLVQLLRTTDALEANHILQALERADSTSRVLCPSLRHVDFSYCPDVKGGPLVRLVKMRLNSASQSWKALAIDTLIIDGCPAVDAEILPWLRSKKDARWRR